MDYSHGYKVINKFYYTVYLSTNSIYFLYFSLKLVYSSSDDLLSASIIKYFVIIITLLFICCEHQQNPYSTHSKEQSSS